MNYGDFVWFDLITPEAEKAADFYTGIVGWGLEESPMGEMGTYRIFAAGDIALAGIAPQAPPEGSPSHWLGYIACEDLEAVAGRVNDKGGVVLSKRIDIEVGSFYVAADPTCAIFALFEPNDLDAMPESEPAKPGHFGWFELYTSDREAAVDFYTDVFGWSLDEAMEIGGGQIYQLFNTGGDAMGGIMEVPDQKPPSSWNFYVRVADIDAATEQIKAEGGQVMHGPIEVPGGDRVVVAADPMGAMISFTGS